jgi:hypothetical protein
LCRGINNLENGYQLRIYFVKDENCDLLANSHSILNRRKNYFCRLLNVHGINSAGRTNTAGPLYLNLVLLRLRLLLKRRMDINHEVLTKFRQNWSKQEVIHYGLRSTNLLNLFGVRKNWHSSGRNLFKYLFILRVIKRTVVIIQEYHCFRIHTEFHPTYICQD